MIPSATAPGLWFPAARTGVQERADRGAVAGDALTFVIPALLFVDFSIVGSLFLSEIVLLVSLPFLLDQARRRGVRRISRTFIVLGVVWLLGQVETDIYRGSAFADYSRGWSKIAFIMVNFAAVSLLVDGRWRRVFLFAAGIVAGEVLEFYFNPSAAAVSDPWKFGLGEPFTLGGVLLASHPRIFRSSPLSAGILVALSIVNLESDFRSLAGVCFVAAMYTFFTGSGGARRVSAKRLVVIGGACALGGLAFFSVYTHAASSGVLGAKAQQKYVREQSSLGVFVGGRPQILVSLQAIRDSPILGHGSWAKDPKYGFELQDQLRKAGSDIGGLDPTGLIPTHSHIFGAWVDAGVLGVVFWIWVLGLLRVALVRLPRLADHRIPFAAFTSLSLLWDIFFSPFGAERRLLVPFAVLVLLLVRAEAGTRHEVELP